MVKMVINMTLVIALALMGSAAAAPSAPTLKPATTGGTTTGGTSTGGPPPICPSACPAGSTCFEGNDNVDFGKDTCCKVDVCDPDAAPDKTPCPPIDSPCRIKGDYKYCKNKCGANTIEVKLNKDNDAYLGFTINGGSKCTAEKVNLKASQGYCSYSNVATPGENLQVPSSKGLSHITVCGIECCKCTQADVDAVTPDALFTHIPCGISGGEPCTEPTCPGTSLPTVNPDKTPEDQCGVALTVTPADATTAGGECVAEETYTVVTVSCAANATLSKTFERTVEVGDADGEFIGDAVCDEPGASGLQFKSKCATVPVDEPVVTIKVEDSCPATASAKFTYTAEDVCGKPYTKCYDGEATINPTTEAVCSNGDTDAAGSTDATGSTGGAGGAVENRDIA